MKLHKTPPSASGTAPIQVIMRIPFPADVWTITELQKPLFLMQSPSPITVLEKTLGIL